MPYDGLDSFGPKRKCKQGTMLCSRDTRPERTPEKSDRGGIFTLLVEVTSDKGVNEDTADFGQAHSEPFSGGS